MGDGGTLADIPAVLGHVGGRKDIDG